MYATTIQGLESEKKIANKIQLGVLPHSPVTIKLCEGNQNWFESSKVIRGYHHEKFERSQLHSLREREGKH